MGAGKLIWRACTRARDCRCSPWSRTCRHDSPPQNAVCDPLLFLFERTGPLRPATHAATLAAEIISHSVMCFASTIQCCSRLRSVTAAGLIGEFAAHHPSDPRLLSAPHLTFIASLQPRQAVHSLSPPLSGCQSPPLSGCHSLHEPVGMQNKRVRVGVTTLD